MGLKDMVGGNKPATPYKEPAKQSPKLTRRGTETASRSIERQVVRQSDDGNSGPLRGK